MSLSQDRWERMDEVYSAPTLRRFNGCGVGLYGDLRDPEIKAAFWKLYCVSGFWVPLIPICAYLVQRRDGGYAFHRKMSLFAFHRAYAAMMPRFWLSVFMEAVGLILAVAVAFCVAAYVVGRVR